MTEYEKGFSSACRGAGLTERQAGALCKLARAGSFRMPASGRENMAIGAVIGGLTGLTREALSDKEKKNYLKAMVLSAVTGGAAGLATSYARENKLFDKAVPYVNKFVNKVKSGIDGARIGFRYPYILR
jgi:hypothetical protein